MSAILGSIIDDQGRRRSSRVIRKKNTEADVDDPMLTNSKTSDDSNTANTARAATARVAATARAATARTTTARTTTARAATTGKAATTARVATARTTTTARAATARAATAKTSDIDKTFSVVLYNQDQEIDKRIPLKRRRSLDIVDDSKPENMMIRNHRSFTTSPIYNRVSSLSLSNSTVKPNEILKLRLNIHEYLKSINDIEFYLNIKKLLANIEYKAKGIVCLSNNTRIVIDGKIKNNFKFAIKIAKNIVRESVKEIYLLEKMIHYVRQGYHNLPIIYSSFEKKTGDEIIPVIEKTLYDKSVLQGIKEFLKSGNYNVYVNELAKGDLKSFFDLYDELGSDITQTMLLNAVAQIIMSIASLHNIGISHNDTHYGNFLYHKIKPGGYIKYTIKDKTYYVENLGYLWVIWDFGISTQLTGPYAYFSDYEMLSLFLRKDENKYNMHFYAKKQINDKIKNGKGKKNEKEFLEVRRFHGNLNFKYRKIPDAIVKLTKKIYEMSIDKRTKILPDIPIDYGDMLFTTKDKMLQDELRELTRSNQRISNDQDQNVLEAEFLTDHIIDLLPVIIEESKMSRPVSDEDILFHVNLQLEPIVRINMKTEDGRDRTDYLKTIDKYEGQKIIFPEMFM